MFPILEQLFTRQRRVRFLEETSLIHGIVCALVIALHIAVLFTHPLDRTETFFLDLFFKKRQAPSTHSSIALITIDEESLRAIGQWPWPWHYHAQMIDLLNQWKAKAILLDLIFLEAAAPFENQDLETVLEKTSNVYFPVVLEEASQKKYWIHSLPVVLEENHENKIWTHSAAALEKSLKGLGHMNAEPDSDGVLRRTDPYLSARGETHPALAVKVAGDLLNSVNPADKALKLPLDRDGKLVINWSGPWQEHFQKYSYADIIRSGQSIAQGRPPVINPETLRDKICLIGLTASGYANVNVTPVDIEYPSLGVHATVLNNILTRRFAIPVSDGKNAVILVLIGFLASFLHLRLRPFTSFILSIFLGIGWILGSFYLFVWKGYWVIVFQPLLLLVSLFLFSTLYHHFVAAQEQKRLFNLATRDGLTGLYVIRYFREILNQAVFEAAGIGMPLSVILLDIDNFKPVNDTYGHAAGDMVLKKAALIINSHVRHKRLPRHVDYVARYGGEEFIIMLRGVKLQEAAEKVAERLRKEIEKAVFAWDKKNIPITLSLGVSTLHPGENVPDAMVRRADEALYQAKRSGKNRVCMEPPSNP